MNLRKLLGLCEHKWKIIIQNKIFRTRDKVECGEMIISQCEKCGKIKEQQFRVL